MSNNYRFVNGDWVQGRSREGELIHGYVETVDSTKEIVKVNVVESDNEKAIGKSLWLPKKWTEKLPDLTVISESQLLSLIDLALVTNDEQWFMELTDKLISAKKQPEVKKKKQKFLVRGNRIGNSN
ncbi:MAG: IDEAL domain-containing protein [Neobacillus sp.]